LRFRRGRIPREADPTDRAAGGGKRDRHGAHPRRRTDQRTWPADRGKLSNASSSNGSPGHVGGELFKFMSGTEIVHIPYRGGAAAINDLIAGRVQLMFESLNSIAPHARSGTVLALAGSGERRSFD